MVWENNHVAPSRFRLRKPAGRDCLIVRTGMPSIKCEAQSGPFGAREAAAGLNGILSTAERCTAQIFLFCSGLHRVEGHMHCGVDALYIASVALCGDLTALASAERVSSPTTFANPASAAVDLFTSLPSPQFSLASPNASRMSKNVTAV